MENIRKDFKKELKNLEISEEEELTVKLVTRKFKKKALKVHSDKNREKDDEEFKELLNDYNNLKEAISEVVKDVNVEDEQTDLQSFFEKHNFAREFSQSWTIFVEKEKVNTWKNIMSSLYPDYKNTQGNGTQFKTQVEERIVYTTLYDVEVPKMNIQGHHNSIRKFVFNILPELYSKVRSIPTSIQSEKSKKVPINAKVRLSGETVFSCEVCPKTYVRKAAIKKHIQMKHGRQMPTEQVSKTPIPLGCVEMARHAESIVVVDDISLDEVPNVIEEIDEVPQIIEEIGPQPMESNWQCGVCGYMFENETTLKHHMEDTHVTTDSASDKIVYLIPEICKQCSNKDVTIHNLEARENLLKQTEKKLEVLERRHEQLKQKYDDITKANKEYSKTLVMTIKENTELKASSEKEAEVLMDTLHMNQVLMEEIKVKDAIIKTHEYPENDKEQNDNVTPEVEIVSPENEIQSAVCSECDWTSPNIHQLPGHMLKHAGQYICPKCNDKHKTKNELNEHMKCTHKVEKDISYVKCGMCDKNFISEHSLKQHTNIKHINDRNIPVGHPLRAQKNNQETLNIKCTKCDKNFATGNQVDEHMKLHEKDFERTSSDKICRYFRKGYCAKGELCVFKHIKIQLLSPPPMCNRGQDCTFLKQNRCKFFHSNIGVQSTRKRINQIKCKFQEKCWNKFECNYSHENQVFRPVLMKSRPPQGQWVDMNIWQDY